MLSATITTIAVIAFICIGTGSHMLVAKVDRDCFVNYVRGIKDA